VLMNITFDSTWSNLVSFAMVGVNTGDLLWHLPGFRESCLNTSAMFYGISRIRVAVGNSHVRGHYSECLRVFS
jgi:hypothetical protein